MNTKFRWILCIVLLLAMPFTSAEILLAVPQCDLAFVTQSGNIITVAPTGVDDTANIQCAFDLAVSTGPGMEVTLTKGTFYTAQIVANDFHGGFSGAGAEKTLIYNLLNMYVTPVDFYLNPPSIDNPWPALFAFVGGDFAISDLAIHISGENITTGWSALGGGYYTELVLGIGILGSEANARIDRISLEGEVMENQGTGYNIQNGIYFQGFLGEIPWPSISGSFQIFNSTFKRIGFATPVFNISDAAVKVSRNKYEDTFIAMDASDTRNTTLEFSHNNVVDTWLGFDVWDFFAPEHVGSTFLIKNNVFQSEIGISFEQTFGEGNECLILGNNVQNVTDLGIYLGSGTTGCMVVGGNNKTNVYDEGTGNILVGVNNMHTGVGPQI